MKKIFFLVFLYSAGAWCNPFFLNNFPPITQSTHYSCGAAALLSVFHYYGIDSYNESELMQELGTNPKEGTDIGPMVSVAIKYGLHADKKTKTTLKDLEQSLKNSQPVILAIQAWPDKPKNPSEYVTEWNEGHFVVLIGMDSTKLYFMDPSLVGSRGVIPKSQLKYRWHDIDEQQKLEEPALFFEGAPKPPPNWAIIP